MVTSVFSKVTPSGPVNLVALKVLRLAVWQKPTFQQTFVLMKTSRRRLVNVFHLRPRKTSSRRIQDVFMKTNIFLLLIRL